METRHSEMYDSGSGTWNFTDIYLYAFGRDNGALVTIPCDFNDAHGCEHQQGRCPVISSPTTTNITATTTAITTAKTTTKAFIPCECINPFVNTGQLETLGDPETLCRTKGSCYVDKDAECRDIELAAGPGRYFSQLACQVADPNSPMLRNIEDK